jgi:hypothetical protein
MKPTAVHAVGAEHDAPPSSVGAGPSGKSVGSTVQPALFQRSASVNGAPPNGPGVGEEIPLPATVRLDEKKPTVVQASAPVHETPLNPLDDWKGTLRGFWIVQVVPFQRSAIAAEPWGEGAPEPAATAPDPVDPTASHAVSEVQDTPSRLPALDSWRPAVVSILQVVPFQRSARVCVVCVGVPPNQDPTAMQTDASVHTTPFNLA